MNRKIEMYKYEWLIHKCIPTQILNNCPDKLYAFRIHNYSDDDLKIIAITADVPEFNTIDVGILLSYINIIHARNGHTVLPKKMCPKPVGDVIAYKQSSVDVLCQVYEPLVHSLTKKAYSTLDRYYSYNDLLQDAYLTLIDLYNSGYYINANLIKRAYYNRLFMQLRKLPTRYVVISFDEPTNEKDSEDNVTTILDTIADTDDKFDELLNDMDLINKRKRVINIIGSRQYDQMLREFKNNQTTNATRVKINKLKRRFNNEQ